MYEAISAAQKLYSAMLRQAEFEQIKLTAEGWLARRPGGGNPHSKFAARHGCEWNKKEDSDLMKAYFRIDSVQMIALAHRRTEGSILSRMRHLIDGVAISYGE